MILFHIDQDKEDEMLSIRQQHNIIISSGTVTTTMDGISENSTLRTDFHKNISHNKNVR